MPDRTPEFFVLFRRQADAQGAWRFWGKGALQADASCLAPYWFRSVFEAEWAARNLYAQGHCAAWQVRRLRDRRRHPLNSEVVAEYPRRPRAEAPVRCEEVRWWEDTAPDLPAEGWMVLLEGPDHLCYTWLLRPGTGGVEPTARQAYQAARYLANRLAAQRWTLAKDGRAQCAMEWEPSSGTVPEEK